jgi:tRNA threonylcarbamoyladenosine biosynthesis protein TsaB
MKVLGIETSGSIGGVAIADGGCVVAETVSDVSGHHLERGAALVEDLLRDTGLALGDLDGVAVSLGPGSFTGLRVGLALAKGICFGRGLPLVGVPTLDCIAEGLGPLGGKIVPVKDARRGEVYFCFYEAIAGRARRLGTYRALSPELLVDEIREQAGMSRERSAGEPAGSPGVEGDGRVVLAGDALAKYGEVFRGGLGSRAVIAPEALWNAKPATVAELGSRLLEEGKTADLDTVEPLYVRASEAERQAAGRLERGTGYHKKDDRRGSGAGL